MGEPTSDTKNKYYLKQLEKTLIDGHYGFRKLEGKFGREEQSYFIPNMTRSDAIYTGKLYNQKTVIWGNLEQPTNGEPFMQMYEIYLQTGQVKHKSQVVLDQPDAKDFFSKYKGHKFSIPITGYTDNLKNAKFANKSKAIIINKDGEYFDKYGNKVEFNENISEFAAKRITKCLKESFDETKIGKWRWWARCDMDHYFYKIVKIIDNK